MTENKKVYKYQNVLDQPITIVDVGVVDAQATFVTERVLNSQNIKYLGEADSAEPAPAATVQPAVNVSQPTAASQPQVSTETNKEAN